jgi:GNAT superfamily N-acetyltransferase
MSDPIIRALTVDDIDDAVALSTIVGWNQRPDDWRILLRLAPAGAFAALVDTRFVGTAIGIDYGSFAWIAMMLVNPAYRGRGVGRRLLDAAIESVPPNHPIRLDATALGRPLYLKCGFTDETTLSRHISCGSHRAAASASDADPSCFDVTPMTTSELKTVIEQQSATFGGTRGTVLDWAFRDAPEYARVVRSDEGPMSYCLGRRGRLFDQIGPVVATDESIAKALVSAALAVAGDRAVVVDAFDTATLFTTWLRSRGFSIQRPLVRMCRRSKATEGPTDPRSGPVVEFAIFGPEFA